MGHLWLQVLPRGPGDKRREIEEALVQHKVEKYPDDYGDWLSLGELKLSRLDSQGAVSALQTAVRIDPKQSQGHNILGAAFTRVGRAQEAAQQFQLAVQLDPEKRECPLQSGVRADQGRQAGRGRRESQPRAGSVPERCACA